MPMTMEGRGRFPPGHATQASASGATDLRENARRRSPSDGSTCCERAARLLLTNASQRADGERCKLYATHKLTELFRRLLRPSLANKTAMATSILFLAAISAVGLASLSSFRNQLLGVLIAEQDTLVERIADNVDQKLIGLKKVLGASAAEITDGDVATFDAAQAYLDRNTGLHAAVDRSIF